MAEDTGAPLTLRELERALTTIAEDVARLARNAKNEFHLRQIHNVSGELREQLKRIRAAMLKGQQ